VQILKIDLINREEDLELPTSHMPGDVTNGVHVEYHDAVGLKHTSPGKQSKEQESLTLQKAGTIYKQCKCKNNKDPRNYSAQSTQVTQAINTT
jgi:hypothetical protein